MSGRASRLVEDAGALKRRGVLTGAVALAAALVAKLGISERVEAGHNTNIAYDSQTVMHVDVTNTTSGSSRISSNIAGTAAFVALNNYPVGISRPDGMLGRTMYTTSGCAGVAGACEAASVGIGVLGTAKSATGVGVFGFASSVVPSHPMPQGTGVYGMGPNNGLVGKSISSGGTGVRGESTTGLGVHGLSGVHGVVGHSSAPSGGGFGVMGTSISNVGVYGEGVAAQGVYGQSTSSPGVQGQSAGSFGVLGLSTNSAGVVGLSSSANAALYGENSVGGPAAQFVGNVVVQGNLTVTGSFPKSAAVPHPDGTLRRMYCQEAPEPWFEDFGEATLKDGRAVVQIAPDFDAVIKDDGYQVFLTAYGDLGTLYVADRTPDRFEVRSDKGTGVSGAFGYRVVGRRRDLAPGRMEKVSPPKPIDVKSVKPVVVPPVPSVAQIASQYVAPTGAPPKDEDPGSGR